ncbi:hypothetical protein [Serratia quinivorans]|uniref:hypothetical protein n=1 Tax=Serratia quinivorans TaxID=137545 RepID=UPI001C451FC2|nr:hypothetical protein [Serratia quinivorans]MBV6691885.1 hypothetical protein [Serratia quinivorans]
MNMKKTLAMAVFSATVGLMALPSFAADLSSLNLTATQQQQVNQINQNSQLSKKEKRQEIKKVLTPAQVQQLKSEKGSK